VGLSFKPRAGQATACAPVRVCAAGQYASAAPTATTSPLNVYGRTWELTVRPTNAALGDSRSGVMAILLLAALAVTFLLQAFLLVLSGMEALARRLMSELSGAARYVSSILPTDLDGPVPVTSRYIPSEELGGDSFDYRWVDDDHLIAYVVVVSGHGIGPAAFSVSVHNLLRSGTIDDDTLRDPGRVLTELNRLFQMEQQDGNYFTIWYGVYQPSTRTLRRPARCSHSGSSHNYSYGGGGSDRRGSSSSSNGREYERRRSPSPRRRHRGKPSAASGNPRARVGSFPSTPRRAGPRGRRSSLGRPVDERWRGQRRNRPR
jgi:hypothetical protein